MNISAINCTPIKPKTSFSGGIDENKDYYSFEDVQKVMDLTNQLDDSFTKEDNSDVKQKSKLQTAVSVAGALDTTFALGKSVASYAFSISPKLPSKLNGVIKAGGNFIKNNSEKLASKNGKVAQFIGKNVGKLENTARQAYTNAVANSNVNQVLSNIAGVAAVGGIASKVITVDGNKDGVKDIAQENVNAYKNALGTFDTLKSVADALA
jgi:hypothetical protein